MKRPVLVAIIGYIIGILWGLYFKINIVPFYLSIIAIYFIVNFRYKKIINSKNKFKLISVKRYFRYVKLIIKPSVIIIIFLFSIISNRIIKFQESEYESVFKREGEIEKIVCIIVSNREEKEYYNTYKIHVIESKKIKVLEEKYFYLQAKKNSFQNLEYGDMLEISGNYKKAEGQRNYGGFDYQNYLKTKKIYGIINVSKMEILDKKRANILMMVANDITCKIKNSIDKIFNKETGEILKGVLLGDSSNIEENIKENFRNASMAHILAISGMHISYVIIGVTKLFNRALGKRITKFMIIIFLLIYMFITGFSPSVIRATIMGILVIVSNLAYRKNDFWTSIATSLFIILIYNPYLIMDIGLQLSYFGVIGIILFQKTILEMLANMKIKNKKYKGKKKIKMKIVEKIKEILAVGISAQITILPIILYHYNTFNPYFFISNFLLSIIIGPTIILGVIFIILSFFSEFLSNIIAIFLKIGLQFIIFISNIGKLPLSKIYIPTPSILQMCIFFIIAIIIKFLYPIFRSKDISVTRKKNTKHNCFIKI